MRSLQLLAYITLYSFKQQTYLYELINESLLKLLTSSEF